MVFLLEPMNLVLDGALLVWVGGAVWLLMHNADLNKPKREDSAHNQHPH
ncbi:MAG: hypothetical protein H0W62_14865 [Chitinophagales bacterium]|nr:hypothetical protein [Chitinophagales bacterium]